MDDEKKGIIEHITEFVDGLTGGLEKVVDGLASSTEKVVGGLTGSGHDDEENKEK